MAGRLWWAPVVLVGLAVDRGSRVRWLFAPAIVVLAACVSAVGKLVIRRSRPGSASRIAPLGHLGAAGFPSTHTACAFAIAGWMRGSRLGRWLHLVAVAIGYLRVRRRSHYLGDVVAGAALGYGIAWKVDSAWSDLRPPRGVGAAITSGDLRAVGGPGQRSVPTAAPHRESPPRHVSSPAPAGRRASRRRSAGGTAEGFRRRSLSAIVSALAVR